MFEKDFEKEELDMIHDGLLALRNQKMKEMPESEDDGKLLEWKEYKSSLTKIDDLIVKVHDLFMAEI